MIPPGSWRRHQTVPVEDQVNDRLGLLLHLYGLRWPQLRRLTWAEWVRYRAYADQWREEQQVVGAAQVALVQVPTGGGRDG